MNRIKTHRSRRRLPRRAARLLRRSLLRLLRALLGSVRPSGVLA